MNKSAANELGLPLCPVDSNFSVFVFGLNGRAYCAHLSYLANYSSMLGLQRGVRKYYASSSSSYFEILKFGLSYSRDRDIAEFSESYSVPLLSTENTEIIVDGCQYERTQKTENIADWYIARKYLEVS